MISVVLPCFREPEEMFVASLDSMIKQTYANIEIIVVIDGENPVLEKVLRDAQKSDDRIRFVVNDTNRGLPYALNRGISIARGGYIARMDADDIALPDRLEKELAYLQKHRLDLVGTYCETISEYGDHVGYLRGPSDTEEIYKALERQDCMWHPTWLFHWEVWNRVGGYENFRYSQDYHFLLKARKMGIRLGVVPEICLQYRVRTRKASRKKPTYWSLLPEYFAEHADDIMDITPKTWEEYLQSDAGQKRIQEIECYMSLRDGIRNNRWFAPLYGIRLLMIPYGRKVLRRALGRRFGNCL